MHFSSSSSSFNQENNEVLIHIDYAFQKVFSNIVILNSDEFLDLVQLLWNEIHLMLDDKNDEVLQDLFIFYSSCFKC